MADTIMNGDLRWELMSGTKMSVVTNKEEASASESGDWRIKTGTNTSPSHNGGNIFFSPVGMCEGGHSVTPLTW